MSVLEGLKPEKVFEYFEEICGIPHGSGNVGALSDYLLSFAGERGLSCTQDEVKNIIIVKPASAGYETEPAVMLQGHMDMVAVKKPGLSRNMETEGLDLRLEGDAIYAEGTSLGGDDGIAVAYALAILDDDSIAHPRLEVVITVDEETGMDGARAIDLSGISAKRLINLDSEDEGIFLTSCAGGARVHVNLPAGTKEAEGIAFRVSVEGLLGGHSGTEIDKERGNSNCIMGRLLYALTAQIPVCLRSMEGGLADNAIPRQTVAELVVAAGDAERFKQIVTKEEAAIRAELATKDPDFGVTVICMDEASCECADEESTAHLASCLVALPNGVQTMSADVKGLVETSLNLGIMKYDKEEQELALEFSVRSSVESAKHALIDKLGAVTELAGGYCSVSGDYPGWAYRVHSPLREKMVRVYEEMYGKTPVLMAIHAGLECGILAGKIEDLDCISLGPDMKDIHTTEERLSVSSVQRVWEFLIRVLARKG